MYYKANLSSFLSPLRRHLLNVAPSPRVNSPVPKLFTIARDALLSPTVRADSDVLVNRLRSTGRPLCRAFSVFLSFALLSLANALAGEKIKLTESPEKIEIPKEPTPLPGIGSLPKIGSGEVGANTVFPVPGPPMVLRSPKLEEALDRKKNWIFGTPDSFDRNRTIEETYGVRKYELDEMGKKSKSQQDRYFESKSDSSRSDRAQPGRPDRDRQDGLDGRNSLEPKNGLNNPDDPDEKRGIIPELNPAHLFNWSLPSDPFSQVGTVFKGGSVIPRGFTDPGMGAPSPVGAAARDPAQPRSNFERAWDLRNQPFGRFTDPINDPADATRSVLNPISARKPSAPAPETAVGKSSDPFNFGYSTAPVSTRPDVLGGTRDYRSATGPFTPPAAAPVSAPRIQPKPAVLEIPRPRF